MARAPYNLIVSLGDWCAPAANIRRHFGVTQAMPFDWWITPYNALIKMLEEDFANILRLKNLEVIDWEGIERHSVRCNYYEMLHHHDFKRDGHDFIMRNLRSQIKDVRSKTKFIIDRFCSEVRGKRVLFVRNGLYGDLWCAESGIPFQPPTVAEQINRAKTLHSLLLRKTKPAQLDLLILSDIASCPKIPVDAGNVEFDRLGDKIGDWFFWEENYRRLFERYEINLVGESVDAA